MVHVHSIELCIEMNGCHGNQQWMEKAKIVPSCHLFRVVHVHVTVDIYTKPNSLAARLAISITELWPTSGTKLIGLIGNTQLCMSYMYTCTNVYYTHY